MPIIQHEGTLTPITELIKELLVILMLPVMERIGQDRINIPRTLLLATIPAMIFGAVQIYFPLFNIPALIPSNPIFLTVDITSSYLQNTGRIVGTYSITIGFAFLLGVIFILLWAKGVLVSKSRAIVSGAFALLVFILIMLTQTRSAIYGLFPAIGLAYFILVPSTVKRVTVLVSAILIATFGLAAIETYVTKYVERAELDLDPNTYHKITANIYSVYAALSHNPLIGVPVIRSLDSHTTRNSQNYNRALSLVREGHRELGAIFPKQKRYQLLPTEHNLFGFYLKYYGLIGFFLLLWVLYRFFRKCISKEHVLDRYFLTAVFFYYLQYAMLHNTSFLTNLILWTLVASGAELLSQRRNQTPLSPPDEYFGRILLASEDAHRPHEFRR